MILKLIEMLLALDCGGDTLLGLLLDLMMVDSSVMGGQGGNFTAFG